MPLENQGFGESGLWRIMALENYGSDEYFQHTAVADKIIKFPGPSPREAVCVLNYRPNASRSSLAVPFLP